MSLLLESNSADTDGEESQNRKHDLQSLTWQNIKIDGNKMAALVRVIKSIIESTDDLPQIIEAGKAVEKASSGIEVIMIPLCLLARITNHPFISGYRTTRRTSSEL